MGCYNILKNVRKINVGFRKRKMWGDGDALGWLIYKRNLLTSVCI